MLRLNVEGLRDFRAAMKRVGPELQKELQRENKQVAEEVASQARQGYQTLYRSGSGRGASSIRGLATQTSAAVAIGGARTPYVLGQEFGSLQGPRKQQFPAWRGNGRDAGYFFWPAIRRAMDKLPERYAKALDKVAASAFPNRGR